MTNRINLNNIVRIDSEYYLDHSVLHLTVHEIDSVPTRYNPRSEGKILIDGEAISYKIFYALKPHYTFRCTLHDYYFDFPQYGNNNKEDLKHRNCFKNIMISEILSGNFSPKYSYKRRRFNDTLEPVFESTALQKRVYAINRFRKEYNRFFPPLNRIVTK